MLSQLEQDTREDDSRDANYLQPPSLPACPDPVRPLASWRREALFLVSHLFSATPEQGSSRGNEGNATARIGKVASHLGRGSQGLPAF